MRVSFSSEQRTLDLANRSTLASTAERSVSRWLLNYSVAVCLLLAASAVPAFAKISVGTFSVDATPEPGSPLAYDPMKEATEPLSCRGLVVLTDDADPVVLCTVDWLGVANAAQDRFCEALAEAVKTTPDRVAMHALHQHDAPRCDLTAAEILAPYGITAAHFDVPFIENVIARAARAAKQAKEDAQQVVGMRYGQAQVEQVASNRRMLGPDGKVHTTRYTACRNPEIRALPEGVVDPFLRSIVLFGEQQPLACLTFYATHPQSYYRTGGANPDFPGMARNARQDATGVFHLHFNGAGGNIGAGKYNDGAHENRQVLANRVTRAMQQAWQEAIQSPKVELRDSLISWRSVPVEIPVAAHLQEDRLMSVIEDEALDSATRCHAAEQLAFARRIASGHQIEISKLQLAHIPILMMPGELFVEYQLAAQEMNGSAPVCMAAYRDYGTAYIGTRVAYPQGGYEVSPRATNVAPAVELVLIQAMRDLLDAPLSRVLASDFTERTGTLPSN